MWNGQSHTTKKIQQKFGDLVSNLLGTYKTPGAPNYNLLKPNDESKQINEEDQEIFCSGIGSLLYLVKHSRPDISNIVRELAIGMSGATPAAFKELRKAIKVVLDTQDNSLLLQPKWQEKENIFDLSLYSDSDWTPGDKNTPQSVSGFIMYLCGSPILWKSILQRTTALSSTETEYYAISEATNEI